MILILCSSFYGVCLLILNIVRSALKECTRKKQTQQLKKMQSTQSISNVYISIYPSNDRTPGLLLEEPRLTFELETSIFDENVEEGAVTGVGLLTAFSAAAVAAAGVVVEGTGTGTGVWAAAAAAVLLPLPGPRGSTFGGTSTTLTSWMTVLHACRSAPTITGATGATMEST